MNDDFLHNFRKPPRREFAADLYQRISKPMKTTSHIHVLRLAGLAFAIVAVIAAVFAFSPATRAMADNIIHQIGGYVFVQAPPKPDPIKVDAKPEKVGQHAALSPEQKATLQAYKQQMGEHVKDQGQTNPDDPAMTAPDTETASQMAGFTVIAPAYVPDGYTVSTPQNTSNVWMFSQRFGGMSAMITYESSAARGFLTVEELKYQEDQPRTVERPQVNEVTVSGQPGVWMPGLGNGKSALVWEENGIMYWVVSNTLPLEELMKVAESLGK